MNVAYGSCTSCMRNGAFVPVIFRFENFRRRNGSHKIPLFQRVLWWARQGLNLRPHPCEGEWRSRVTILFSHDKIRPPNVPCTSFVRGPLVYAQPVYVKAFFPTILTCSESQSLPRPDLKYAPQVCLEECARRVETVPFTSSSGTAEFLKSYGSDDSATTPYRGGVS